MTPFLFFVWFHVGREVPAWQYKKLFERADLVVIATAESTKSAGNQIKERPGPRLSAGAQNQPRSGA